MRWLGYLVMALLGAMMANIVASTYAEKAKQNFEVIMFSVSLCDHCAVFEQETVPLYQGHELAKLAPLKKVNIDEVGTGKYHLRQPIETVPTFVIMNEGKEIGRLNGMVDKFMFLAFIRDKIFNNTEIAALEK